jgi:4-hydroxy-tetrahydrodipicolinate reductase
MRARRFRVWRMRYASAMSSTPLAIAVHGAAGRMGRAIVRLARDDARFVLAAALVRDVPSADLPIPYSASLAAGAKPSVLIDFSTPAAFDDALALALDRRIAFVSGTTGLSSTQDDAMKRASTSIPIVWSANFSVGVAVLARLVRDAAKALAEWDADIFEAHHRDKKDAPSGTALALGRAIADVRGVEFDDVARNERNGARESGTIGFSSMRGGDIVGEHVVAFVGDGERIELAHRATHRDIFARGALAAALRIAPMAPGFYAFDDLIG